MPPASKSWSATPATTRACRTCRSPRSQEVLWTARRLMLTSFDMLQRRMCYLESRLLALAEWAHVPNVAASACIRAWAIAVCFCAFEARCRWCCRLLPEELRPLQLLQQLPGALAEQQLQHLPAGGLSMSSMCRAPLLAASLTSLTEWRLTSACISDCCICSQSLHVRSWS
jgi:hypothetical protein